MVAILTHILNIFDGLFETIVIFLFFKQFVGIPKFRNPFTFVLVLVLTVITVFINTSNVSQIITLILFICFSLCTSYLFNGSWQSRVQATIIMFLSLLVTSITVSAITNFLTYSLPISLDENSFITFTQYISGLFLFLILTLVVKYKQRKKSFMSFGSYAILLIPLTLLCIICLYHLTIMIHSIQQPIAILLYTFSIVGFFYLNLIVLYLIDNTLERYKLSTQTQLLTQQINYQVENYEQLIESQQEIRKIKHDMKVHLICLNESARRNNCAEIEDYLTPLLISLNETSEVVSSGNMVIDALLNHFHSLCKSKNIKITIEVPSLQIKNITHTDLCIVLGNAMTNAIEACQLLRDEKMRFINVSIFISKSYLIIDITNSCKEETLSLNKSVFLTSKQNKICHGFGLQNIQEVISRYDGSLQLTPSINTFHFSAVLKNN